MSEHPDEPPAARALGVPGLAPHPEGGWYRRTWTSPATVSTPGGERPAATLIQFLLPAGEASAWHVVASDEVWLWQGGGAVALQLGGVGDAPVPGEVHSVGPGGGRTLQVRVPAGAWQRTLPSGQDAVVGCLVSPGFDFADFRLAAPGRDGDRRAGG